MPDSTPGANSEQERDNATVPKVPDIGVETPMTVEEATRVFGSPLRAHLLRYYRKHPGHSQVDAAQALGLAHRSVGHNIRILVTARVVIETTGEDRRTRVYRVDENRILELLQALRSFAMESDE